MAWVAIRTSLKTITPNSAFLQPSILKSTTFKNRIYILQASSISGKALRDQDFQRPKPWPYKQKGFNLWHSIWDDTKPRFNENSKLIVVEGPPASEKTKVAKALADDFDMLHFPEVTLDEHYINSYGYDMRQLDPQLPDSMKSFDHKNFCKTPSHPSAANFQMLMYKYRFSQYIDALVHILNTGQGVVLERCVYSDYVFLEAMRHCNYISKGVKKVYYEVQKRTLSELMKPHLVIYLDIPVAQVKKNVARRNLPHEVGSDVYNDKFLEHLEKVYKQEYLRDISTHAELLIYDWSQGGDVEVVAEDIERISFDESDKHDPKFKDWKLESEYQWVQPRLQYTRDKDELMCLLVVPQFDAPELIVTGDDVLQYRKVWYNAPGMKYAHGYNAEMGDSGLLFKTKRYKTQFHL